MGLVPLADQFFGEAVRASELAMSPYARALNMKRYKRHGSRNRCLNSKPAMRSGPGLKASFRKLIATENCGVPVTLD